MKAPLPRRPIASVARADTRTAAKKISKPILDEAPKSVKSQIQGDELRVTGKNRDDLQTAIAHLRKSFSDTPLNYTNFRD